MHPREKNGIEGKQKLIVIEKENTKFTCPVVIGVAARPHCCRI